MTQNKYSNKLLEKHVYSKICELNKVDIVVGIPSYNNSETIGNIISIFAEGLKKYYPSFKSIIINADTVVEGDAGVFERMKGYLINRWDFYKSMGKKINIQI